MDRVLWGSTMIVALGTFLTAALFLATADLWWPATLLLFGPRWVLLAPVAALVAVAAWRDRLLLAPLTLSAGVVVGPIMGLETGWRTWATRGDPDADITIVTFNAAGRAPARDPRALMEAWGADVAAVQECSRDTGSALRDLDGWHVASGRTQCLVSRFEILERRDMEREALEIAGGAGLVASYRLAGPTGPFWLTSVHLETPRDGLALIRYGNPLEGLRVLRQKGLLRAIELRQAEHFASGAAGPHIAVGDFNTPPESRLYRAAWGGWTNAFSVAGLGFGRTRLNGWIRARIDHVVVDGSWRVVDARLGEDVGSDHLPLIAVVRLR